MSEERLVNLFSRQEAHKAWTSSLPCWRLFAACLAIAHLFHPCLSLSFSTVLRQVVLGQPLFLFPSGFHPRVTAQSLFRTEKNERVPQCMKKQKGVVWYSILIQWKCWQCSKTLTWTLTLDKHTPFTAVMVAVHNSLHSVSFLSLVDELNNLACSPCLDLHNANGRALQRERRGHGPNLR